MSIKLSFKSAVIKAKRLYKTGRYKKFSDAVKAAYGKTTRKMSGVKKGHPPAKKKHTHWGTVVKHERRVSGMTISGHKGELTRHYKDKLSRLLLFKAMATTKTARRKYGKEAAAVKRELKKYSS